MKLNSRMPRVLVPYYQVEIQAFRLAVDNKNYKIAWHYLERAHIIAQRYPWQHTQTHWKMLCLGIKKGSGKEVFGQLIRLIFGAPLSFINSVPIGNVGSTRVSMILPQKVPKDLESILQID